MTSHDRQDRSAGAEAQAGNIAIIRIIRYSLFIPIIYGLGTVLWAVLHNGLGGEAYSVLEHNLQLIFMSLIAIGVTFMFTRMEKRLDVHLPRALIMAIILLVVASLVLGEAIGMYQYWWWDDMLHTLSGVIIGFLGFLLVYLFNARYNMHMNPHFVALFSFTFAVTMGVLWEIFEFSLDVFFGMDTQRWNLPANAALIGRDYQGSGLRDTMSDLIVTCAGAVVSSSVAFFSYKNERSKVLALMRRTFPGLAGDNQGRSAK